MHRLLLASATCLSLFCGSAALAQAPDQSVPAAGAPGSDANAATDTPAATGGNAGTSMAPKPHHHHVAGTSAGGQTFAHEPGTGESGPASAKASNIDGADSHSEIAPHLPAPRGGENAGPFNYLRDAEQALNKHRTGEAQQALEMAETRLLDRSTPASQAGQPDQGAVVQQVSQARQALGHGDIKGARSAIAVALTRSPQAEGIK